MIFIYGRKRREEIAGYAADFCPVCMAVRSFKLIKVFDVFHLYYISLGKGNFTCFEKQCKVCKTNFEANMKLYRPTQNINMSIVVLEKNTFPNLREYRKTNFELLEKINKNELSPEDKQVLANSIFTSAESQYHKFVAAGALLPGDYKWGCLTPLALFILFVFFTTSMPGILSNIFSMLTLLIIPAGLIAFFWFRLTAKKRYIQTYCATEIGKKLKSLKFYPPEIGQLLYYYSSKNKLDIAKHLTKEIILEKMR